jgi:anti-sigma-K factor RskA
MSAERGDRCRERWHDDLAAYALGALPEHEAAALERHLAECPACTERLRWLQPAVDLVPASVPPLQPPPELRERLMTTVRAEAATQRAALGTPADGRRRSRLRRRLEALRPPRPRLALAAAVLAAVLVAGIGGYALRGDSEPTSEAFAVESISPRLDASGTLRVDDGEGTLVVENLPPLPGDDVYQVWTGVGGELRPSSTFVAEADGRAATAIPELPEGTDRILVTREPAGGSETATTAPVLRAALD